MDGSDVTEVCRLCPANAKNHALLNVFDERISVKNNMKEVILVTTGIEILESDIISKKICAKCYKNMQKIDEIRQTAISQDQFLKEKCQQYLGDQGIRLPNTCITIKHNRVLCPPKNQGTVFEEVSESCTSVEDIKEHVREKKSLTPKRAKGIKSVHPTVIDIYRKYPRFKLPKKCLERHISPIVSLAMNEVETYFKRCKLDMDKYIYKPSNEMAEDKTISLAQAVRTFQTQKSPQTTYLFTSKPDMYVPVTPKGNNNMVIDRTPAAEKDPLNQSNNDTIRFKEVSCRKSLTPKKRSLIQTITDETSSQLNTNDGGIRRQIIPSTRQENKEENRRLFEVVAASSTNNNISQKSCGEKLASEKTSSSSQLPSPKLKKISSVDGKPTHTLSFFTKSQQQQMNTVEVVKESTNKSVEIKDGTSTDTTKPEFIQSLGLTPAVASGPPHKSILICKICKSLQPNVAALKKHVSRHRICPFCKLKFKSVERKENHVDNNECPIKNIMDSPGVFVSLEKIDFNHQFQIRYKDLFNEFGLISSNEHGPLIVLSDSEESQSTKRSEKGIQEVASNISVPDNSKMESVSVVRPIVSIHNNTILNEIGDNACDKGIIKELVCLLEKAELITKEQAAQTALPQNQDVVINLNDTCHLKHLKHTLQYYMVPVTLKNGDFSVLYTDRTEPNDSRQLAGWNEVPLIEKRNPKEIPVVNTTCPLTFLTSQVQSSQLSVSSIQLMTATPTMSIFLPNTSAFIPGTGLSIQPSINNSVNQTQAINNAFFNPITSTSLQTTPLLQNYTLSMTPVPVINNQVAIQTTTDNATVTSSTISNSKSSSSTATSRSKGKSSRKSLSVTLSKTKKLSVSPRRGLSVVRRSPSSIRACCKRQIIKLKMGNVGSRASSRSSKLRVKNIWELK